MLVDLACSTGDYLHEVFVNQLDWWIILGFVAQVLFTMRFVVQWVASERAGKSIIPFSFWTFSIGGGALLLVYAIVRRDPVYILGQASASSSISATSPSCCASGAASSRPEEG